MRRVTDIFILTIVLGLIGGLFANQTKAQKTSGEVPPIDFSTSKQFRNPSTDAPNLQTKFDQLIDKAQSAGTVKVIIGFKIDDYKSDAEIDGFQQMRQRGDIKQKQANLLNSLDNFTIENPKQFDYIPFIAMELTADALDFLRNNPDIISIQEDVEQKTSLLESVPLIGAPNAWSAGFTGQGLTVAILDTGVDRFHPFFNGRVVSEACYSTTTQTTASTCPGGVSQSTAPNSGLNCDVNIVANCSHGTHVAGIAAGGNPQINGAGVAKNANIIAIQVFSYSNSCGQNPAPCTTAFTSDTIKGLERVYALRNTYNIASVNMSLGGGQYFNYCDTENSSYKAAIDNLRANGTATIIASGNEGHSDSMSSPACISSSISVGSTHDGSVGQVDTVSTFSNSVYFLNLLAPGEQILSSEPGGIYNNSQGTSQAAPHVAGAWAIMKQKFPNDTVAQTYTRLKYSGIQVLDTRNSIVKPRIRIDSALNTSNIEPCTLSSPINLGQTINEALTTADCILSLGNRTDIYTFSGTQGQGVALFEGSNAFDTYLYLLNSNGSIVAQDNNGGGGTNSRIPAGGGFVTLPATGTYYIYATSLKGNVGGNYTLSLTTDAPACNYTLSSAGQNFGANGGVGNVGVTSTAGCNWTAQSSAAWLSVTSGGSGNGNGATNYSVSQNTSTAPRSATLTIAGRVHNVSQSGATAITTRRPFDFDGDGKSDVSVYRPSNGAWYLDQSTNGFTAVTFGISTDLLAPADFDGDGKTDVAVFRNGNWYYLRSTDSVFVVVSFGQVGDLPRPADFDGDGKADVNVFRPSNGAWYRLNSSNGGFVGAIFGQNGDKPLVADFDGDNKSDIAVFRPSSGTFYWLNSSTGGFQANAFGFGTDIPTMGDFDGDGKTDIAVFRPSNGVWYRYNSSTGGFALTGFGQNGDVPVTADFDGDGKSDIAVFRPSANAWYYLNSSNGGFVGVSFGASTDKPIPASFQ